MDARKNNSGVKGNKGNRNGYYRYKFISEKVAKHSEDWWTELARMMKNGDKDEKKFAMSEFNKLQVKMVPQTLDGGEDEEGNTKPLEIRIVKPDDN